MEKIVCMTLNMRMCSCLRKNIRSPNLDLFLLSSLRGTSGRYGYEKCQIMTLSVTTLIYQNVPLQASPVQQGSADCGYAAHRGGIFWFRGLQPTLLGTSFYISAILVELFYDFSLVSRYCFAVKCCDGKY